MTQEDRYDRTARVPDRGRPALGGAATAVVTALAAIVMVLLAHGLFEVPVLAAHGMSAWESVDATAYALGSEVVLWPRPPCCTCC